MATEAKNEQHKSSPAESEAGEERSLIVSCYTFLVQKWGAKPERARTIMETAIAAIELVPARAAVLRELFIGLDGQGGAVARKLQTIEEWLTLAHEATYWPRRLKQPRRSVLDVILPALETGPKTLDELHQAAFPDSTTRLTKRKLKRSKRSLGVSLGRAAKAGQVICVGRSKYALPKSGLPTWKTRRAALVGLVIDGPKPKPQVFEEMHKLGHTPGETKRALKYQRESGVLAPPGDDDDVIALSRESEAKRDRREPICNDNDVVLWAPPFELPAEIATWERRLIEASRKAAAEEVAIPTLRRPRVDLAALAPKIVLIASMPAPEEQAARAELVEQGVDPGWLDLTINVARACMEPVGCARKDVHKAALEVLRYELGTAPSTASIAALAQACRRLAAAIIDAGGPGELAEIVLDPPHLTAAREPASAANCEPRRRAEPSPTPNDGVLEGFDLIRDPPIIDALEAGLANISPRDFAELVGKCSSDALHEIQAHLARGKS